MGKLTAGLATLALALLVLSFVVGREPAAVAGAPPVAPSPAPTPTLSPAAYGRALFQSKGCTACHRHDGIAVASTESDGTDSSLLRHMGAPDLTHYQPDPTFIRTWLKDPQEVRPNTAMPNLRLLEVEIEALLAFLQTNTPE